MKKFQASASYLRLLDKWKARRSATGTISVTRKSKRIWDSLITPTGCAIGPRALGCHVQDCIWPAKDHEAPFTGGIDFEKLIPLLPTNCLFVWEMSPNKTADAIRQSARIWKERFGE